jgi:hypothetical protein
MRPKIFKTLNIKYIQENNIIRSINDLPIETELIKDIFFFKYEKENKLLPKINEIFFAKGIDRYYIKYITEYTNWEKLKELINLNLIYA